MYLQKVISKKTFKKLVFCCHLGKVTDKNSRIRIYLSEAWIRGSRSDPDPPQNVMDPQHCRKASPWTVLFAAEQRRRLAAPS
jgi:hypothetical protein